MLRWALVLALAVAAWAQPADVILRGAAIYTMDGARSWAQELAVGTGGRILYVGKDASAFQGPSTRVLDLRGKMVLPGFCDAHVHPLLGGVELGQCNVSDCGSIDAVRKRLKEYAAAHPDQPFIQGSGWDVTLFPSGDPGPSLNEVVTDRPVALYSSDGHSLWANPRALALAGVTAATQDPPGGRVERRGGQPTGTFREHAMDLVEAVLPEATEEQLRRGLDRGLEEAARFGITTMHEANATPASLETYLEADREGRLTCRIIASQQLAPLETLLEGRRKYQGRLLATPAVKLFADGVLETRTGALLKPYSDGTRGDLLLPAGRIAELVRHGFQVHVHAIGDRAVRETLDQLEAGGRPELRPHIAHLQLIDPADRPRFRRLGVAANFQPFWCYRDRFVALVEKDLGRPRSDQGYPLQSMLASGATVVAGSDWTVTTLNPLEAIQVAVTRQPLVGKGPAWVPAERCDLPSILAAYTVNGAWLGRLEAETGSLEVGKAADLIVLSRNLFEIPAREIHKVKVELTMLEGRIVYSSSVSRSPSPVQVFRSKRPSRSSTASTCCGPLSVTK